MLNLYHLNIYTNLPCTLRTTGSLYRSSSPRIATTHTTTVLLYVSVAGTCKKDVLPILSVVISGGFSCDNGVPLTSQPGWLVVALQLNVAVDPSVVLTDVGVRTNPGM